MGAFAEMSGDLSRIYDIIAHDLARIPVSYYNGDAKRTKGMYRQRIQKARGHTAHRGRARLLLDRARDLKSGTRRSRRSFLGSRNHGQRDQKLRRHGDAASSATSLAAARAASPGAFPASRCSRPSPTCQS